MVELFSQPETYLSLLTLAVMEIILGIDNIVFITILCGKLPGEWEHKIRRVGIAIALISRLALLGALSWIMGLKASMIQFEVFGSAFDFSGRDLILLFGGIFLVGKASHEIYESTELPGHYGEHAADHSGDDATKDANIKKQVANILGQVIVMDLVFSLDSVITAVGMVDEVAIMVVAMIIAVGIMLIFAGPVGDFVQKNASVKILALSFLVLIGAMLIMEGMGQHVSKGYIYAAMGFALSVELINLRRHKKLREAVQRQRESENELIEEEE